MKQKQLTTHNEFIKLAPGSSPTATMGHRSSLLLSSVWCLALGLGLILPFRSQGTVSPPAGFHRIDLLGNSDTFVSFPFTRPEVAAGRIAALTSPNVVTLSGNAAWVVNQFVYAAGVQTNTYYLLVCSGSKEGVYYPIVGNGADSLTLDLRGDTLAELTVGERVAVIPFWTLGTVFPGGQGVHASSWLSRKTEINIPNAEAVGINPSANRTYFVVTGHWYLFGDGLKIIRDDEPLLPDAYFIVRHKLPTGTTLTLRGNALTSKWVIPLRISSAGKQDNVAALPRPAGCTLNASGLIESGAFLPTSNRLIRKDELNVYDNSVVKMNKSPAATYFYFRDHWERLGYTNDVGEEPILAPGTGFIIRKAKGASNGTALWTNEPNY